MDKFKMRPHSTPSQIYVVPQFHVVLAPIQCLHGHGIGHREKDQHSHEEMAGSTGVPQVGSLRSKQSARLTFVWQTPLDRRLNIATGRGLIKLSWPGLKSVPRKMSWEVKAIAYDLAYNPHSVDWSIQLWLLAPYAYIRIGLRRRHGKGPIHSLETSSLPDVTLYCRKTARVAPQAPHRGVQGWQNQTRHDEAVRNTHSTTHQVQNIHLREGRVAVEQSQWTSHLCDTLESNMSIQDWYKFAVLQIHTRPWITRERHPGFLTWVIHNLYEAITKMCKKKGDRKFQST